MPAIYVHRLFGEDAAELLPEGILANQEERLAFYLGNQGPDPFFFRWRGAPQALLRCHAFGHEAHAHEGSALLTALREAVRSLPEKVSRLGSAFALGQLGHWWLDSTTHPFIYAEERDILAANPEELGEIGPQVHAIIESALDAWMLWTRRHRTVTDVNPADLLAHTPRTDTVAGALLGQVAWDAFGIDLSPADYGLSVRDMRSFYRFAEPAGSLKAESLGHMERLVRRMDAPQIPLMAHEPSQDESCPYANPKHLPWADPQTGAISRDGFLDLYERALAGWPELVRTYLAHPEELTSRYPLDYAGRTSAAE